MLYHCTIIIGTTISRNKETSFVLARQHKQLFNGSTPVSLGVSIDQLALDESTAVYWYHNGGSISSTATATTTRKLSAQSELNIKQPTILHTGVYETQLGIRHRSRLTCDNPSPYTFFVSYQLRFWYLGIVVTGSNVQQLIYSGKKIIIMFRVSYVLRNPHYTTEMPRVEFTAQRSALPSTLNTSLTCTAVGGYPPVKNITLYKNNALLTGTSSSGVHYNTQNRTTSSQYGKYRCLIYTKINVFVSEISLQEKGMSIININEML